MNQRVTRVLGFDFGMKYVGVAAGQTITQTATPIVTLTATDGIPDWKTLGDLIDKWAPTALVVGLPLNQDGSTQHIIFAAKKFANRLKEKFGLPIYLVDETLTTWEAKQQINPQDFHKVNAVAAAILLEQWLRSL